MTEFRQALAVAVMLTSASLSLPSQATVDWQFSSSNCSLSGGGPGNTGSCASSPSGGPDVTVTAWSNTVGTANKNLEMGELFMWSGGWGSRNQDWTGTDIDIKEGKSPEHAVDNNERVDSVLLAYDKAVTLSEISIGWPTSGTGSGPNNLDTDISVAAYTLSGTPSLAGKAYDSSESNALTANGWELVGHYSDLHGTGGTATINDGSQSAGTIFSSSHWMVSAYNKWISDKGWSYGNDHLKFSAAAGTVSTSSVPEPGSVALLVLGLPLLLGLARRSHRTAGDRPVNNAGFVA